MIKAIFAALLVAALPALAQAAGSPSGYQAALSAATSAEQQAGALGNQWTPTQAALKAAQKAAAAKDFDVATTLARHAEALAKLSIAQARTQETAWRAEIVR